MHLKVFGKLTGTKRKFNLTQQMENNLCCAKCNESFEEGEIVGCIGDRVYHGIFESAEEYHGCADKMPDAGVYYRGKVYDMRDIAKLKNLAQIRTKRTRFGFKLAGDLEGLIGCEILC